MPQNYQFQYKSGVSYVTASNVQGISITVGRQRQLDQYSASTARIEIRYPTGYASPVAEYVSGTQVIIRNATSNLDMWIGRISNVEVRYGIPYSGGVGNADRLTITCEGAFAQLGRMQGNEYALTAGTLSAQIFTAATQTGLALNIAGATNPNLSAYTVSGTWGDWFNMAALTTNGRVLDGIAFDSVTLWSPFEVYVSTINFSDTANNATNQVYDNIEFASWADNYYSQVTVDPDALSPVVATKAGATAPYRTYRANTLNSSTSQATDLANYLLNNYDSADFALTSISCLAEAQNTFKLDSIAYQTTGPTVNPMFAWCIGTQVNVTFRGATFTCIIEGATMTATPESSRYTFYLSGADLNAYLRLNNAVFGQLNYNKLGY